MDQRQEAEARTLAALDGGKIVYNIPGEGGVTLAYLTGKLEGWWKYGRGVFNGDCVCVYAERHWRKYMAEAKELTHV